MSLQERIREAMPIARAHAAGSYKKQRALILDSFEYLFLEDLVAVYKGNLSAMERAAGLSRRHIRQLLRKHGLFVHVLRSRAEAIDEAIENQPDGR